MSNQIANQIAKQDSVRGTSQLRQQACTFDAGGGNTWMVEMDAGVDADLPGDADYENVSPRIGFLLSHDPSLAGPLATVLGLEDMYDLIEVVLIDRHNDRLRAKRNREQG